MPMPLMKWGSWLVLLVLLGCQPSGCSEDSSFRMPLDPTELFDFNYERAPREAEPTPAWNPQTRAFASRLRTPRNYRTVRTLYLEDGMILKHFDYGNKRPADPRYTVRALMVPPEAFDRLRILFSDTWARPLSSQTVLERRDVMGLLSWCFFGRIPAGDMIGLRCRDLGRNCKPGIYHNAEKRTGKNINLRWTLALNHQKQFRLFRGGLGPDSHRWYRLAMGGGILLFDPDTSPSLYASVGRKDYASYYLSSQNNHQDIVRKGQAGYLHRATPRSAAGLMPDGSFVFVNLGEGQYRFDGGATPASLAAVLKQMGLRSAVMYDGGGAPQMALKSPQGRLLVRTLPERTRSSDYSYNYAFLTLTGP